MSPIYEEEGRVNREDLLLLVRANKCAVCGARLDLFRDMQKHLDFIACTDFYRTKHEGIIRPQTRYEKEGLESLTIERRRQIMTQEHGEKKTSALEKYQGGGQLTKDSAMHILKLVYPNCPEPQIVRTAILCQDFGLHPLMKEVYLIPFKNKDGGSDYATVIGIAANRKIASAKKGSFSFMDDSPRAASHQEIVKQFGDNSLEEKNNLISICKLKGEKGNTATGFGLWPKDKNPQGTDKGNTPRNMANIRAERQALDRLPGEAMPLKDYDVIDESYTDTPTAIESHDTAVQAIEASGSSVDMGTGEIIEQEAPEVHRCEEHGCDFELKTSRFGQFYSHPLEGGGYCKEKKKADPAPAAEVEPPAEVEEKPARDPETLKTFLDLYKACSADFKDAEGKGMQPPQVLAELGVSREDELSDTPADCYRKIAAVRQ